MFQYVEPQETKADSNILMDYIRKDPEVIPFIGLSCLALVGSIFFCAVFTVSWQMWLFCLIFISPAPILGFIAGRIKREILIRKTIKIIEEEEKEEKELQKVEDKTSKPKVLDSKDLLKHKRVMSKQQYQSALSQNIRREKKDYDI